MPANYDTDHPERPDSDGSLVPTPRFSTSAIPFPAPTIGSFLIDTLANRLLAADALATLELPLASPAVDLSELLATLPEISEDRWNSLLDQNDKQRRTVATSVNKRDGSKILANLIFVPFEGFQKNLLLLTIEPLELESAAVSHRDALTGLPDRRALAAQLDLWNKGKGCETFAFALLFMDLDQFKQINDIYGHAVGDRVLATLAQRWQSCVRGNDLVVRYGGDEFIVLVADIANRGDVEPVIARLTKVTSEPVEAGKKQLSVGVSIGVALSGQPSGDLEQLIHAADRDMYASKQPP